MLVNKKKDMTPYDMRRRPARQYPILMPLIWGGAFLMTRQFGLKIEKVNMGGIKPPFLVIGTHQGFSDYYIGPLAAFPHRAMYVSDMEGFAGFGNWLYRGLGCIPKRRFVADFSVISNVRYAISKGQSVFIYPESRHSNIGTTSYVPKNMGRLCKLLKVPVVTLSCSGSYLANPFWNESTTYKVPIKATMECIYTTSELEKASETEVQDLIENKLQYDEYDYMHKADFKIKAANRAQGIHRALYICRECGTPYKMHSSGSTLSCGECGTSWSMTEDGWLIKSGDETKTKIHIPDWYEIERSRVISDYEAVGAEKYKKTHKVRVEALPNEYGFVVLGDGELTMDSECYRLVCDDVEGKRQVLEFPHKNRESVQTEYDYRGKGEALVLSTKDCCYYLYSKDADFNPTEHQFLGEYLFQKKNGIVK